MFEENCLRIEISSKHKNAVEENCVIREKSSTKNGRSRIFHKYGKFPRQPGVNRDKGGYVALYFDELFNMHNFFGAYRPDRTWNLSVYPRVGVNYNFGVSKGALLLGFGVLNTYRLSNRWSVYLDAAYIMTGSGFVGSEKVEGTGTGSNSNGYFSIG